MTLNVNLDTIPEIKELPKLERNEARGGFAYPEEFIGNIYKHHNKLVFFSEKTMEEASLGMVNLLISIIKDSSFDNSEMTKRQDDLENAFEQFETDVLELIEKIKTDIEIPEFDTDSIKLELSIKVEKAIKDLNHKIEIKLEENNLEMFKELEKLKSRDDLSDIISSKVDQKLTDVYNNFKVVTENLVKEEVRKIEEEIKSKANKLTVSQIAMFREMGLSVEHIIELKKNNML